MEEAREHASLMDATYRYQRLFYDATRAYYLLGRDHLIGHLDPPRHGKVLELACGTGRNLDKIIRRYPETQLFGLDISREMLRSAEVKLAGRANLAFGDACHFDGRATLGAARFDRIVLSFGLSMIPDWRAAVTNALRHLAANGEVHIVDFGTLSRLPVWFDKALIAWLQRFHVVPVSDLADFLDRIAGENGLAMSHRSLYRDYAQYAVLRRL